MFKIATTGKLSEGMPRPIVHCHGCFDMLHIGHVKYLQEAKKRGSTLIVTITSDRYVNKGSGRPIFNEKQRAEMLEALACVDHVFINDAPDAIDIIHIIRPDFYMKGIDYKNTTCEEFEIAKKMGAELVFATTSKFSTTELIENIKR